MRQRTEPTRHPGESRDPVPKARSLRHEVPAFAGMTGRLRHAVPAFAGMTVGALMLAGAAIAQGPPPAPKPITLSSRPGASGGEALYLEHCASCHAANGMGTGLLARRVQPALLEARDNLPAAYVTVAVRQGVGNMPAIPRGEVSDAELQAIAEYLAAGPHEATP